MKSWRSKIKKRRGKAFHPGTIRELNLVAMMDMLTVVVVFLLKSYTVSAMSIPVGEQISIPTSANIVNPTEAVKLTVTKAGAGVDGIIAVDEEKVLTLDKAMMEKLEGQVRARQFLIPELQRVLVSRADGIKEIAKLNPQVKFEGQILVIADKDTPYWLVSEVLFTAAEAQFDQYRLVATRKND